MVAPLEGIRVLEVANWIAIPSAGALMADMGADVVKVEPREGDAMRDILRKPQRGRPAREEDDFAFQVENRGKRSIAVALDQPEGQELIQRIVPSFDVFTTNLLPHRQQRYRLDPETVLQLHPGVVYASLTAYGHDGPKRDEPGFDTVAFLARSGAADLNGEPEGPPARYRPGQGDHPTGFNILAAVLAALRLKEKTGHGQVVEVSLLQTAMWSMATDVAVTLVDRKPVPRVSHAELPNPLNKAWRCADGRWIFVYEQVPRGKWPPFCEALGHPEWIDDPRFSKFAARAKHLDELNPLLEEVFLTRTMAEWGERFDAHHISWHPIAQLHEAVEEPQLRINGTFVEVEHPRLGRFETLGTPFRVRGADIRARGAAPDAGTDTRRVLAELGVSAGELAELHERGVVGPAPRPRRRR